MQSVNFTCKIIEISNSKLLSHINGDLIIHAQFFYYTFLFFLACTTGDVRLTGGSSNPTSMSGRVEICLGGKWGTIADAAWNANAATVVCRQLRYAGKPINITQTCTA